VQEVLAEQATKACAKCTAYLSLLCQPSLRTED